MNKLLTLRCDALFQGRLAQSLSWRPPKVKTHKFPANNIQIEFGNEYNSARLKLHSYVDFVWYLIQNNGDLDQFLKITKSQKFSAWMVQIFHKMPKRVCSNWWKMKEKQEEQKSGSRSWASVTFFNSCNKLNHMWFFLSCNKVSHVWHVQDHVHVQPYKKWLLTQKSQKFRLKIVCFDSLGNSTPFPNLFQTSCKILLAFTVTQHHFGIFISGDKKTG